MRLFLVALFATVVAGISPPSADSVDSNLQILLHNDRYGNESNRKDAVIALGAAQSHVRAAKACASLSESLWTPSDNIRDNAFLTYLSYQTDRERSGHSQKIWRRRHDQLYHVAGSGPKSRCMGIDPSTGRVMPVACEKRLPALCTQSPTISEINNTDLSLTRQTQVLGGKAVYTGWRDKLSFRFLGIKYGTFRQRFTDSSPMIHDGEVDALDFGARCVSRDGRTGPVLGAEDCLFLNIYTPYLPRSCDIESMLKPVMVWIHGGAFLGGAGSDPTFDGGNLASRGDVVVVTINYRQASTILPLQCLADCLLQVGNLWVLCRSG